MNRLSAAALGALLLLAPACSESEAASVAGTYQLDVDAAVQANVPGADTMPAEQLAMVKQMFKGGTMELQPDGTFTSSVEMLGQKMTGKGTWTVANGAITLNQTHENDAEKADTATATVKDGTLALTAGDGEQARTLTFKKQVASK